MSVWRGASLQRLAEDAERVHDDEAVEARVDAQPHARAHLSERAEEAEEERARAI